MVQYRPVGSILVHPGISFNGVKIFSATLFADRAQLGERVTQWIADNPGLQITEIVVTQSSDASFHCYALTVFYREPTRARA
jgi:hypothetical protein